jgi:CHAD domain-containing protein
VGWQFRKGEALDASFRRVAGEEIARIRVALTSQDIDRAQAIHQARRSFKRLRALLRLAKPGLGASFAREDRRWRDAGRLLASSRDATVLLQTFDQVVEGCGDGVDPAMMATWRSRLAAMSKPQKEGEVRKKMRRVVAGLDEAEERLSGLSWPQTKPELRQGLKECQARLKRCWKDARSEPKPTRLHAWRKRIKDYTAQVSLVRAALPHELKGFRAASRDVGDILGEEHDLSLLKEKLLSADGNGADGLHQARERLIEAIDAKRRELCKLAFDKGENLSSHRPKAFADEIAARLA